VLPGGVKVIPEIEEVPAGQVSSLVTLAACS
jgi:hypothetical protein